MSGSDGGDGGFLTQISDGGDKGFGILIVVNNSRARETYLYTHKFIC